MDERAVTVPTKDEIIQSLQKQVGDFGAYARNLEKEMAEMRSCMAGLPEMIRGILREELNDAAKSVDSPQSGHSVNPSLHADTSTRSAQDRLLVQSTLSTPGMDTVRSTSLQDPTTITASNMPPLVPISPPIFQSATTPRSTSTISVPQVSASAIPDVQGSISRLSLSEDNDL